MSKSKLSKSAHSGVMPKKETITYFSNYAKLQQSAISLPTWISKHNTSLMKNSKTFHICNILFSKMMPNFQQFLASIFGHFKFLLKKSMTLLWSVEYWLQSKLFWNLFVIYVGMWKIYQGIMAHICIWFLWFPSLKYRVWWDRFFLVWTGFFCLL